MSGAPAIAKTLALPDGTSVFYREAGSPSKPTILLLHGFPSSSHQFRNLMPLLSESHHVLAPDFPGFGFTKVPETPAYHYTFASLTNTTTAFLDALKITKFAVYTFDYGAPVAYRIALERPEAITAIVSQNGNAYVEGMDTFWDPIRALWAADTPETRKTLVDNVLKFDTTKWQYEYGVTDPELREHIPPETYYLDQALMDRPGQADIQLSFFKDYENNVKLYSKFHEYFRTSGVPILAIWGANDIIFVKEGAKAYSKDCKDFKLVLLDAGHFAIETHTKEIADEILEFLGQRGL
jgi:pimeloyl-ACP methyl ester carboxylesterase